MAVFILFVPSIGTTFEAMEEMHFSKSLHFGKEIPTNVKYLNFTIWNGKSFYGTYENSLWLIQFMYVSISYMFQFPTWNYDLYNSVSENQW